MKTIAWLGAAALATAVAGSALAAGDSAKNRMNQGASAGASASQSAGQMTQHDPATVRQVQQALKEKGFEVGEIDGQWGPQTQSALRQYQQQEGLDATGQLDEETIAELGVGGAAGTAAGSSTGGSSMGGSSMGGSAAGGSSGASSGSSGGMMKSDDKAKQ